MSRIMREVWLFFWRDLSIARTYRTVFVLEAIEALFGAAMFYYVARFVDKRDAGASAGHANVPTRLCCRLSDLPVCGDYIAHCGLCGVGRCAFSFSGAFRELAGGRGGSGHLAAGVRRSWNSVCELPAHLQAWQSCKVVLPGSIQRGRGNAVRAGPGAGPGRAAGGGGDWREECQIDQRESIL